MAADATVDWVDGSGIRPHGGWTTIPRHRLIYISMPCVVYGTPTSKVLSSVVGSVVVVSAACSRIAAAHVRFVTDTDQAGD